MATTKPVKELNLDAKITIRSIAAWDTAFKRIDTGADVLIKPRGTFRLPRSEVMAQVDGGNRLLAGTDGRGSHATLIIDDKPTLVELGFESADGEDKQLCFSDELVKEVFAIADQRTFEATFKEKFVTRSEFKAVMDAITRLGINDYRKIRFAEEHTGFHIDG